jgi:uracil-DNA glycosylase
VHAGHPACLRDEWLSDPCRDETGSVLDRPIIWSRRNGPWSRVSTLWIGAAPGNAGGRGHGSLGAHGTRIPFGGDVAGANLEVLLGSVGLTRNDTFIIASLNQLPEKGGGEPRTAEILAPAGGYPNSLALLRDTILACGPLLLVALGNVAARCTVAAMQETSPLRLPTVDALHRAGLARNQHGSSRADSRFHKQWSQVWPGAPFPTLLWTTHPSAQNMSPFAAEETAFHERMIETRAAVRAAVAATIGAGTLPDERPCPPDHGIYALPEWRSHIAPRLAEMDRRWRAKGV